MMSSEDNTKEQQTGNDGAMMRREPSAHILVVPESHEMSSWLNPAIMEAIQRTAKILAASQIIPARYQGKVADCFIALQVSKRLGVDVMAYMENSYVVHGKAGIEAKLAIALMNRSGLFASRINWKLDGQGDDRQATCYAYMKESGELVEETVTMKMAKAEGWVSQNKKWSTMPDVMLRYRSATFLARFHAPEVLMGMITAEELRDIVDVEYEERDQPTGETAHPSTRADKLVGMMGNMPPAPIVNDPATEKPKRKPKKAKKAKTETEEGEEPEPTEEPNEPDPQPEDKTAPAPTPTNDKPWEDVQGGADTDAADLVMPENKKPALGKCPAPSAKLRDKVEYLRDTTRKLAVETGLAPQVAWEALYPEAPNSNYWKEGVEDDELERRILLLDELVLETKDRYIKAASQP